MMACSVAHHEQSKDLKKAEALYNEFIFLWTWRNENFVAVQALGAGAIVGL